MRNSTPDPVDDIPATKDEILRAIADLTSAQLVHLDEIAWFRHRSLGSRGAGRQPHDLLSDAMIAALEGRRRWVKSNCDFSTFLRGVLRSLASHIRSGKPVDAFDELAQRTGSADGDGSLEQVPTPAPIDPESQLLAKELVGLIRERFRDDRLVLIVYQGFLDKMKPAEIQAQSGMSEHEYNAAAKRLRRYAREFSKGGAAR
jgi:DNA-directed RNA polymerase specialized sigma24 family protein